MSIVADIILLCDLLETFTPDFEILDQPPAVAGLNSWLEARGWASLVPLGDHIGMNSEAAFQACAYGAALVRLDIPAFLLAVADQPWTKRGSVLLLLKDEGDERFAAYRLGDDRSIEALE